MRVLFNHYLKQKKLAVIGPTERFITPLFDSITSKGYEQLYINKTHDIPLLCNNSHGNWHAKVAMKTSGNDELWSFFSDEQQQHFHLPVLLGNRVIQQVLSEKKTVDKYALILKSMVKGALAYSLIWYDELIENTEAQNIFKRYFKRLGINILTNIIWKNIFFLSSSQFIKKTTFLDEPVSNFFSDDLIENGL